MRKGRLESTKIKQKTRGIDKCSLSVSSILTYVVLKIITNIINVPIFHCFGQIAPVKITTALHQLSIKLNAIFYDLKGYFCVKRKVK